MNEVLEKIGELGLVPVIKIENASDAVRLGRALVDGGLPVAEVTFRTEAAEEAIKNLARGLPEMLIGAGTVLTTEQADRATNAGARFIVSPGFNPKVVDWCIGHGVPVTPGINSPTQLEMALERGLAAVKFFPAEASGGLPMLKAMAAPYSGVKFIPTGGINQNNLAAYLSYERILACGGSWMVKADLISGGKFDEITRLVREGVAAVHGFETVRLGISAEDAASVSRTGEQLSSLFLWGTREEKGTLFVGSGLEVLSVAGAKRQGCLVIAANNLARAGAYLRRKGVHPKQDAGVDQKRRVVLDLEIEGLAVHLVQK